MNKFLEDNRYLDGGTPYIFDKEVGVKRLYINLCGMDKIKDAIVIKKDKIVMHRILGGVIDIHNFFFRCKIFTCLVKILLICKKTRLCKNIFFTYK